MTGGSIGQSLPVGLLEDVETFLGVTWYDAETDRNYELHIRNGMSYLNGKLGEGTDYTVPGLPRTLLFEYVRYSRDMALDVFENNYMSLILAMQNERRVQRYVESTQQAGGDNQSELR